MYRKTSECILMKSRKLRVWKSLSWENRGAPNRSHNFARLSTTISSAHDVCKGQRKLKDHSLYVKYDFTELKYYSKSSAEIDISKLKLEGMDLATVENAKERVLERLDYLMDMMEVEKAVKLIRISGKLRIVPRKETLLNLIQQIANLGEYTSLLDLYKLIKDGEIFSSLEFFEQLKLAYFQSQRIDEAVIMLRIIYHGIRKYHEVDLLFTSICMMILRHFPSEIHLIQSFVDDCKNAEKGQKNYRPAAGLWKCYVLNKDLQNALRVLELNPDITEFVPDMVQDILNDTNKIDHHRGYVLYSLVKMKELPLSSEEKVALVKETLLELCEHSMWKKLLDVLQSLAPSEMNCDVLQSIMSKMEMSDDKEFELLLCLEETSKIIKILKP